MDYKKTNYENNAMIKFENSNYLFLMLLIIPVIFLDIKAIRKLKKEYKDFPNVNKVIRKSILKKLFFILSWCFIVFSLACPLWGSKPISIRQRGTSIIFVSDVSKSMTISDIAPSRLVVQKEFLKILAGRLEKSLCGLVITKGEGILTIPLSFEKNALLSAINSLSPNMLSSSGTNLEAGVLKAIQAFDEKRSNSKIIILCTDGDETAGNLSNIPSEIKKTNSSLIIVGFGTTKGDEISILNDKKEKKLQLSKLEENKLKDIANKSGENSMYINACDFGTIEEIIERINSQEINEEKMVYIQKPVKRNFEMLLISFICICFGVVLYYEKTV